MLHRLKHTSFLCLLITNTFVYAQEEVNNTLSLQKIEQEELLNEYRMSDGYLSEKWRPRFHFTPERNWMNDPNGLVYHKGEYHLFYQHNPYGNEWGHMSWGHAVSEDLVSWKHLPIAIWEEGEEMIFSGCAVVDTNNSSGFGLSQETPMVAIYTSHRPGNQSQSLAFSNDLGRTWTKYSKNPVLDLREADFRDPKVFWHEETNKWIMVVSLAIKKQLQFYGSADLKEWELLSEFGPAGTEPKPNWECPDLFELPIEDSQGKLTDRTAWVLEVDMGGGSIAGGSGGEYFVGTFDGTEFKCFDKSKPSYWVDYGRDFYAPVSWSDIPTNDDRRIWIGWMNNWETHLLPTSPWRSAMSVPRVLSLRETVLGRRLVQRPVKEIELLRSNYRSLTSSPENLIKGRSLDIELEIELNGSKKIELIVLGNEDRGTKIIYDAIEGVISVDRRTSGEVSFHESFPGIHKAPLKIKNNLLRFRVLVDHSSVELFADDGLIVITDRVFPDEQSDQTRLNLFGGDAKVKRFDVWDIQTAKTTY